MSITQIFVMPRYYPSGGADDLQDVRINLPLPTDREVCELFSQVGPKKMGNEFYLNALVTELDGSYQKLYWHGFVVEPGAPIPDKDMAAYETERVTNGDFEYVLVPLELRNAEAEVFGPRGHPDVEFW